MLFYYVEGATYGPDYSNEYTCIKTSLINTIEFIQLCTDRQLNIQKIIDDLNKITDNPEYVKEPVRPERITIAKYLIYKEMNCYMQVTISYK